MRESLGKTRGRKTMRMLSNKWEEPSASILYDKGNKGTYHQKDYSWAYSYTSQTEWACRDLLQD